MMANWLVRSGLLTRVPRRWLLVGSGVLLVLGSAGLYLLLQGFPSSEQAFKVEVANNSGTEVFVSHCVGPKGGPVCDVSEPPMRLPVGDRFTTVSGPGSSNPFVVRDVDGVLLGCLPLAFTKIPQTIPTVYISEAGWCGDYLSP